MPESPKTTSTRRALAWSFAERYAGLIVALASTMLLARLLSPAEVGVYSLCAAFTAVAGILRDFGVSEYIIQERDLTRERLRAAYGLAFLFAWSIGGLIFLLRGVVAGFYDEPRVADVLAVLSLHFFLLPVSSPTFALLNRDMAFRPIFAVQLVSNVAQALFSVAAAFAGWGVMSLAWGPIVNVAVQAAMLFYLRPQDCMTLPGLTEARHVLKFGSMFVTSRTIEVLTRNAHDPIVAKQFDFTAVGLMSRAFGLIDLFHNNIGAAVVRVATPAFARQHRSGVELHEAYARATAIFASVSWAFFGFVALTAEPIIRVMFGEQWIAAAPLAVALAVSSLPQGLFALAPQMLSATGQVSRRLRVSLIYSPLHILLVLGASQFGLLAVASVWFVSNSLMLALYFRQLRLALGIRVGALLGPSFSSLVVAGASIAALWMGQQLMAPLRPGPLLEILLGAPLWAGAWWLAARQVSHPAYAELKQLLRGAFASIRARRSQ